MNRTKPLILLALAFAPLFALAQIKPEFEKALEISLNKLLKSENPLDIIPNAVNDDLMLHPN